MELCIKNLAKLATANIQIDGITVIAGENNTGKSTIGKTLFSVFNAFYDLDKKTYEKRRARLMEILLDSISETHQISFYSSRRIGVFDEIEEIVERYLDGDKERLEDYVKTLDKEVANDVYNKIAEYERISDEEIELLILKETLFAEFEYDFDGATAKETFVDVAFKEGDISFCCEGLNQIKIDSRMDLRKNVVYIDDPFVVDEFNHRIVYKKNRYGLKGGIGRALNHREKLVHELRDDYEEYKSTLAEYSVSQRLENIIKEIDSVSKGSIQFEKSERRFVYVEEGLGKKLEVSNISTGLKSFMILKMLLNKGLIEENGLVILDEPEIHLHPAWQVKYAEILVKLQKEFGLNMLINTHSPYFLEAIETYSEIEEVDSLCKYYLTELDEKGYVELRDVTTDREPIYKKLAYPFQHLEGVRNGEY